MDTMIPPPPLPAGGCVAPSSCSTSHRVALLTRMGHGTCTTNTAPGAVKPGGLRMCPRRMAGMVVNAAARDPGSEGAAEALAQPLCWLVPDWLPTLIPALQNSSSLLFILHLQSCLQALCTFPLLFLAHPAYGQFWPAASCCGRQRVSGAPAICAQAHSFFLTAGPAPAQSSSFVELAVSPPWTQ